MKLVNRIVGLVLIAVAIVLMLGTAGGAEIAEELTFETIAAFAIFFVASLGCAGMGITLFFKSI